MTAAEADDERARLRLRDGVERCLVGLFGGDWRLGELVATHGRLKLLLMAHAPALAKELGRLVAAAVALPRAEVAGRYRAGVRAALASAPSRGRHVNALEHAAGYLRGRAGDEERRQLRARIDAFGAGEVSLAEPLALVRQGAARHQIAWLQQQIYLGGSGLEA